MKAIVYHGKEDLKFHADYPQPEINHPDEVKVKIAYCGICGSDLKEITSGPFFFNQPGSTNPISNKKYPMVMGHEMSGEIVAIGANVDNVAVGDKVVVEVTGTCKDKHRFNDSPSRNKPLCGACFDGYYNACDSLALTGLGFSDGGCAEYVVTSGDKVVKYDASKIPSDVAALVQPLAVSWHAVRVSKFQEGQSALILGGGPIGLTTIFALKGHKVGSIVVSEPALARRLLAEKLNVQVYDPTGKPVEQCIEELRDMSPGGRGFHHSFDCSGVPATFETSIKCLRIRGTATNVAVWAHKQIPYSPMHTTMSEKIVTGSICFVKDDFVEVVRSIEAGNISVDELKLMITDKIPLEEGIEKGFNELLYNKGNHIKILFTPQ
ncbi:BDH2 [Candida margitis]|uniref:BDH2 n=1 Tax=Candida margitis TaxID=1775924 RepID=UPI002225F5F6|nr:BDH2 [Candida margitis]KAI5970099.1 BDH2 [Candida margitis]